MLMFKRSILVLAFLVGGAVGCGSSSKSNPDLAVIGGSVGTDASTGAGGTGGGGTVAVDAGPADSAVVDGAVAVDAGPAADSAVVDGVVARDVPIADSAAVDVPVTIDAGSAADGGSGDRDGGGDAAAVVDTAGPSADAGSPTATKAGHLAIINAPPAAGVVALTVTGAAPLTYDPATGTCQ